MMAEDAIYLLLVVKVMHDLLKRNKEKSVTKKIVLYIEKHNN